MKMSNMVINTNVAALNSHRGLKGVGVNQGRASERLSSGLRINRAADDAAGLAISEKMRSQVRGLNQASRNSQDGISLIQTAEGALQETENMLQRMRELTIQASNGTLEDGDREKIALELNQLTEEIDATAAKTEFNKKKLIDGSWKDQQLYLQVGANEKQGLKFNIAQMDAKALGVQKEAVGEIVSRAVAGGANADTEIFSGDAIFNDGTATRANSFIVKTMGDDTLNNLKDNVGKYAINETASFEITADGKLITYGFNGSSDNKTGVVYDFNDLAVGQTEFFVNNGTGGIQGTTLTFQKDGYNANDEWTLTVSSGTKANSTIDNAHNAAAGGNPASYDINAGSVTAISYGEGLDLTTLTVLGGLNPDQNVFKFTGNHSIYAMSYDGTTPVRIETGKEYTVQDLAKLFNVPKDIMENGDAGGEANIKFMINGTLTTVDLFGGTSVNVENGITKSPSFGASGEVISQVTTTIDNAIETVSAQRATLGAVQNRLEHTIKNLDVASENLSASESRVRDTDMAAEMMKLTQANVLSQAATSMLAQANQAPQNILQLLR